MMTGTCGGVPVNPGSSNIVKGLGSLHAVHFVFSGLTGVEVDIFG